MNIPPKYEDVVAQLEAAREEAMILKKGAQLIIQERDDLRQDLERAKSRYDREVLGLNNEGDPIGGDPAGGYKNDNVRLQQRLTAAEQLDFALSAFAKEMIDAAFEGGSFDGADIQDIAVKHGLLKIENRTEECGEACACREFGFPSECYRKTDIIALKPAAEGEVS